MLRYSFLRYKKTKTTSTRRYVLLSILSLLGGVNLRADGLQLLLELRIHLVLHQRMVWLRVGLPTTQIY